MKLGFKAGEHHWFVDRFDEMKCECGIGWNIHVIMYQFAICYIISMGKIKHGFIRFHSQLVVICSFQAFLKENR